MESWRPYQLNVLLSQYTKRYCQLCHYHPSVHISNSSACSQNIFQQRNRLFSLQFNLHLNTGILCQRCHDNIHWLPPPLHVGLYQETHNQSTTPKTNTSQQRLIIQSVTHYQAPVKHVIQGFKFKEDLRMLPILWYIICQLPSPKGCHAGNSVILPMPTTDSRIVARGFDPLSIITPYLSKHWKIPIWRGVERVDDTISQRGLSRTERQKNIKGAFAVTKPIAVSNVILFDDIATTGSSLQELAHALLSVGKTLQLRAYCLAHGNTIN